MNTDPYRTFHALDPAASVFVSANAGAGKTSLLTGRVLSLLLSGVLPGKILCLTFTTAAAAEMTDRVLKKLGAWVMMDDAALTTALAELTGQTPDTARLKRARSLFATVLEAPDGMRIQTIHGFCQSLLRRFPLEAGVSPHFTVMDSRTEQELLGEARLRLFNRAQKDDPELQEALSTMARHAGEGSFHALIAEIIRHKRRFRSLLTPPGGAETAIRALWRRLHVSTETTLASLITRHFSYDEAALAQWREIVPALRAGDDKEQVTAQSITDWLAKPHERERLASEYILTFLTQKGTPRKTLHKKNTITDETLKATLAEEQERVWRFNDAVKALGVAQRSTAMLHVAEGLLALYDTQKNSRVLMDYDDLIMNACDLLEKPGIAPWVLFKLDGGIDHILVDEAQDTSPEQWKIIDALTQEFFAGAGRAIGDRSLFVVGDEKQSIYSFQGADPAGLSRMRNYFKKRIEDSARTVHTIALTRSFRSTPEVLTAVDAIFARTQAREGLTFEDGDLQHIATRLAHPGLVELWPLITPPEEEEKNIAPPGVRLARMLADTIAGWLKDGTAQAGDIMILVKSRTSLVDRLVRALKKRGVPVAGQDRMTLLDNLAVQDLVALGQCLLLPEDDLTLAAMLKSPIFNLSEDDIFALAWGRGKDSLWERLRQFSDRAPYRETYALLADLRGKADFISPYELYSHVLETRDARRRFTGRMGEEYADPIDEFLGQTLLFERSHPPSLQGFLHWLTASDSEIKRDMEQARGSVRIMTVHGAKGLQAPIVILPDTTLPPTQRDALLWDEALAFWPGSGEDSDSTCAGLRDDAKQAMLCEYRRLLYVALTRAEDRLYICGATGKKSISEDSWYTLVKDGLSAIATPFEIEGGEGLRLGSLPIRGRAGVGAYRPPAEQNYAPLPTFPLQGEEFAFLTRPAPDEPTPPQPLVPSRLAGDEPPSASPLSSPTLYQRGTFIHLLLQYLPDIVPTERHAAAQRLAALHQKSLPADIISQCVQEALAVISDTQFAFLFAENSLAEVPVAGCVEIGGKKIAVAGQVDRLYIGEKEVWIVDFKSNRVPPEVVPTAYLRQMQLYRALLSRIYPEKTVRCALLWTAAAKLTPLDEGLLDEAAASSYI